MTRPVRPAHYLLVVEVLQELRGREVERRLHVVRAHLFREVFVVLRRLRRHHDQQGPASLQKQTLLIVFTSLMLVEHFGLYKGRVVMTPTSETR